MKQIVIVCIVITLAIVGYFVYSALNTTTIDKAEAHFLEAGLKVRPYQPTPQEQEHINQAAAEFLAKYDKILGNKDEPVKKDASDPVVEKQVYIGSLETFAVLTQYKNSKYANEAYKKLVDDEKNEFALRIEDHEEYLQDDYYVNKNILLHIRHWTSEWDSPKKTSHNTIGGITSYPVDLDPVELNKVVTTFKSL